MEEGAEGARERGDFSPVEHRLEHGNAKETRVDEVAAALGACKAECEKDGRPAGDEER